MEELIISCDEHHQHTVTKDQVEEVWEQLGCPTIDSRAGVEMLMSAVIDKLHAGLN